MTSTQDVRMWSVGNVCRWINSVVKLPQYQRAFQENEVNGSVLLELKGDDIREMGITKVGHRKHIEMAIGALRAHLFYATLQQSSHGDSFQTAAAASQQQQQQQVMVPDSQSASSSQQLPDFASSSSLLFPASGSQQQGGARRSERRQRAPDSLEEEGSPKRQRLGTSSSNSSRLAAEKKPIEAAVGAASGAVVCSICLDSVTNQDLVTLSCGDQFCKGCIRTLCETRAKDKQFPVLCPNSNCKSELKTGDLTHVLNKQQLEQFEQAAIESFADHGDFCYCPTPNCGYIFLFDKSEDPHFRCEKCKQHYCLACKCPWHGGASCVQYRKWKLGSNNDDELFLRFVQRANLKRCPTCNRFVEKRGGCETIYCLCGTNFCYTCGKSVCECRFIAQVPEPNNQLQQDNNEEEEAGDGDEE